MRPTRVAAAVTRWKEGRRCPQSVLFDFQEKKGTITGPTLTPLNRLLFKISQGSYYAIRIPLLRSGFKRVQRDSCVPCNVVWRRPFSIGKNDPDLSEDAEDSGNVYLHPTHPQQWVNHFPGSFVHLGSKDGMYKCIRKMNKKFGSAFDITPKTWVLPEDYQELHNYLNSNPDKEVILKPARGSCGRDIEVVRGLNPKILRLLTYATAPSPPPEEQTQLPKKPRLRHRKWVVQSYIDPPSLINERKYDIRLYVAVTSIRPLVAYVFKEGLVRFASEKYETHNRLSQLTNSSLARKREATLRKNDPSVVSMSEKTSEVLYEPVQPPPALKEPKEAWQVTSRSDKATNDDSDPSWPRFKWSLSELKQHIESNFGTESWDSIWSGTKNVILKSLICSERPISKNLITHDSGEVYTNQGFELFGFDIMIDENNKPSLIEVNCIPSLESSSNMDWLVKCGSVTDLFNMLNIQPFTRGTAEDLATRATLDEHREHIRTLESHLIAIEKGETCDKQGNPLPTASYINESLPSLQSEVRRLSKIVAASDAKKPKINHPWDPQQFALRISDEVNNCGGYEPIFPTKEAILENAKFFEGSPSESRNRELWEAMGLKSV
eukprot:TRINITY_DN10227_c0_g1_i1.p1 TRINITY_DN10227_c0_g1~~TRINITY_DN10227_c0_g1_i1.p1  ORF type:complete len:607 (+),score=106.24 TRINITY_DN10227_c0_g1_i1:57-1877(+)